MKRLGIDLFITGDIKYHEALDSLEEGVALLDIGHYEAEIHFCEMLKGILKDICYVETFINEPVFKYL